MNVGQLEKFFRSFKALQDANKPPFGPGIFVIFPAKCCSKLAPPPCLFVRGSMYDRVNESFDRLLYNTVITDDIM